MNILIRKAKIQDIEAIADIKIDGWQTAYRGIIDDEFLDNMDRNVEIEKRRNSIENIIVAEYDSKILGFWLYRDYNKNLEVYPDIDCELSALYVKTEFKRQGIGRKLMQYVMDELKKSGKCRMILGCLKENYPSRAFYEAMGGKVEKYDNAKFGDKEYELAMYVYEL